MENFLFLLGLSTILVHEMDAVRLAEWRILLGFLRLSDEMGYLVFTALHLPLYLLLFWFLFDTTTTPASLNSALIRGLDGFFILHVGLHWAFRNHRHYQCTSRFSTLLIGIPGLCGALDLALRK